jgi:XTP/dITP diphosphohydrolase
MVRKFTYNKLLIATNNEGKVVELRKLLSPFNIELVSAAEYNLLSPDETGVTFQENAELKAKFYSLATNLPALADDSGLCVDALNGEPGVYSARWADGKDFNTAIRKVEQALLDTQKASVINNNAHFICHLTLFWPDGHMENFEGRVDGTLTFPPRGTNGFGFDPIFIPNGYDITFAEMEGDKKNKISHRTQAFEKLIKACF